MIKVISFFFNKEENNKLYREGEIIRHFTKEQEDRRIELKHAIRLDVEKKEGSPKRSKKEKK